MTSPTARRRPGAPSSTPAPSCGWPATDPRAANVVGLTDQTDLFFTISDALGLR